MYFGLFLLAPFLNRMYNSLESKKVNLETNSITFNIEIPKKEFISKFYNALRSVKIPTAGVDYEDFWRDEQLDSDIVRKYCEK